MSFYTLKIDHRRHTFGRQFEKRCRICQYINMRLGWTSRWWVPVTCGELQILAPGPSQPVPRHWVRFVK